MKRFPVQRILPVLIALALLLSSCTPLVDPQPESLSVYATFYPIYALSSMIVEEIPDLELHCLVQPQDGCLRAYSLSDWDIYMLAYSADAVISGGSGLESFDSTLQSMGESGPAIASVLYGLELYTSDRTDVDETSHLVGENPHLYMSVDGVMEILDRITAAFVAMDARYAAQYEENLLAAQNQLATLHDEVMEIAESCSGTKVALLNEAAIYPAMDLGLDVVAWIDRESGASYYDAELEGCLETLKESGAEAVLIERQAPKALVDALRSAGYAVALIDIMNTYGEEDSPETYLNALLQNAMAIAEACAQ